MKKPLALLVVPAVLLASLLAPAASADATLGPDGAYTLPVITIHGRSNKPSVTIILRTPTATESASAAHEDLRSRLLERTQPAPLR